MDIFNEVKEAVLSATPGEDTRNYYRNQGRAIERERIIKLLEEHIPIEDNYNMESSCRGCDWEWAWNGEVNDSYENHIIALIKGEK